MPRSSRRKPVTKAPRTGAANRCRLLLVIDNAPLHAAAWAGLQRARQRLEKATRDLHRHEEADVPGFRQWLARTFPAQVSAARDLTLQIESKRRLVDEVASEAFFSGRPPWQVWQEWQANGGRPPPPPPMEFGKGGGPEDDGDFGPAFDDDEAPPKRRRDGRDPGFDDFMRFFNGEIDMEEFMRRGLNGFDAEDERDAENGASREAPEMQTAKAIYRRLVQHLHPDRGGEWTPARARLWAQVQDAWNAQDADWLARLEVEWEAATDRLGPQSPVGRLRAAVAEIEAARRDADRKLRQYRKDLAWRFTLLVSTDLLAAKMERALRADLELLREQREDLERTVAEWERAARRGSRRKPRNAAQQLELF